MYLTVELKLSSNSTSLICTVPLLIDLKTLIIFVNTLTALSPESIARYKILEVQGSLGMVASSNAEAGHASNEHAVPTKLVGILDIEQQVLKLLECEDNWIQQDLTKYKQLELHCLSKQENMDPDSGEWKALHHLTRFQKEQEAIKILHQGTSGRRQNHHWSQHNLQGWWSKHFHLYSYWRLMSIIRVCCHEQSMLP